MMQVFVCLVFLILNAEGIQDLSGKVFTFPKKTSTAHVRVTPQKNESTAFTVCHRSFTDIKRDHTLFSLATAADANEFLVQYNLAADEIQPHVRAGKTGYGRLDYKPNMWHSICTTWDSSTLVVQLWFDGRPLTKRVLNPLLSKTGPPIIVLGQDQDNLGGGFDINQSFEGMMTDVHMWNYVLSSCEIQNYMSELSFTPGNMINWAALDFSKNGLVWVEDKQMFC